MSNKVLILIVVWLISMIAVFNWVGGYTFVTNFLYGMLVYELFSLARKYIKYRKALTEIKKEINEEEQKLRDRVLKAFKRL
jgi:hypothetical protein